MSGLSASSSGSPLDERPFMERYGLRVGSFLAKQLEVNQMDAIPNGLVLELSKVKEENNCTNMSLCSWILKLSGMPHDVSPQGEKAIISSLARLQERYKALLKSKHRSTGQQMLTAFLESSYTLPKLEHATRSTTHTATSSTTSHTATSSTTSHTATSSTTSHTATSSTTSHTATSSTTSHTTTSSTTSHTTPRRSTPGHQPGSDSDNSESEETQQQSQKVVAMEKRINTAHDKLRNVKKKLHRRERSLEDTTDELKEVMDKAAGLAATVGEAQQQVKKADERVEETTAKYERLTQQHQRASRMLRYYKQRSAEQTEADESEATPCEHKTTQERELQQELLHADNAIAELEEELEELTAEANEEIETYRDGHYTDSMRQCCMSLLALNVGIKNVGPVIMEVLKLADRKPSKVPTYGLLQQLVIEGRSVSHAQIAEAATSESASTTLHYDGTTKAGQKYHSFQSPTEEGTYTLSVTDVASGSAEHMMQLFKDVVSEIQQAGTATGVTAAGEKLVSSLTNTMTDRASVNTKFNELLRVYRQDVLSTTVEGWNNLSEDEKSSMRKLNNHFCGLHLLVNLAEQSNAVLREFEASHAEHDDLSPVQECGTIRLIRTACKLFERHGSEKAGRMVDFAAFCKSRGLAALPLAAFRGNRFNILFFDAAGVYFLRPLMLEYCSFAEKGKLPSAVAADLEDERFVAGSRALGIIGKLITASLWRFLVSDKPFAEVFQVYGGISAKLAVWAEDAADRLDGSGRPFKSATVHSTTDVFNTLFTPAETDQATLELLQLLAATLHGYMSRVWSPYLPGGQLTSTDAASMQSLPKTNVISEHDFGQLDRFLREKPNATTLAIESMIMLANNRTMSWLANKSDEDRAQILKAARPSLPQQRQLAKQRKLAIHQHREHVIQQQQAKKQKQKERQAQRIQSSTVALTKYGGLWVTQDDMQQNLEKLQTQSSKCEALKSQLRFRKHVMLESSKENAFRFAFSKAGKVLPIEEMQQNLQALMAAAASRQPEAGTAAPSPTSDEEIDDDDDPQAEQDEDQTVQ